MHFLSWDIYSLDPHWLALYWLPAIFAWHKIFSLSSCATQELTSQHSCILHEFRVLNIMFSFLYAECLFHLAFYNITVQNLKEFRKSHEMFNNYPFLYNGLHTIICLTIIMLCLLYSLCLEAHLYWKHSNLS